MRTVSVYQCETDSYLDLELVGLVRYTGDNFWGGSRFTDGEIYQIVRDHYDWLKVVDNRNEDYIWDLFNPRPSDGSSPGGKFELIEDYTGELTEIYSRQRS